MISSLELELSDDMFNFSSCFPCRSNCTGIKGFNVKCIWGEFDSFKSRFGSKDCSKYEEVSIVSAKIFQCC
uniref:Uncharacterized protein n=1 Tax=Lepeophtheirus salmonis TaxID=72036 RepID=A0A0K2TE29_LEPSM